MMMIILQSAALLFCLMSCGFIIAHIKKNNSIADICWGLGFILISWFTILKNGQFLPRQIMITTLVTVWGARLAIHILMRNWGKPEDPRYTQLAKEWSKRYFYLHSFFKVFMLQGLLLFIIALPIIIINTNAIGTIGKVEILGLIFWCIGFFFEAIGDWQLNQFLKNPQNHVRIMDQGLWSYTRHPNYFGEVVMWWSIWLMAFTLPYGLLTIISPITITTLLLFVSGIPMAEKQLEQNPHFAVYKKRTSVFFPWPPKN